MDMRSAYKILVKNMKGKKQLERSRRKWDDNIKIHLTQTVCVRMCTGFTWFRDQFQVLINTVMILQFTCNRKTVCLKE